MSIRPLTDIVLDVAKAADPARYQEAAAKLSTVGGPLPASFDDAYRTAASTHMPLDARGTLTAIQNDTTLTKPGGRVTSPQQQFEAFVLQSFIESMLPRNAASVFGKGNAGGIWKSMLAEQIGGQISRAGGLGIARILSAAHPSAEAAPVTAASPAAKAGG